MAAYNDKQVVRGILKPSPSAIYNNLTLSSGTLVYAHTRTPCVLAAASINNGAAAPVRRVDAQTLDVIHVVRACAHHDSVYVLVGTEGGLQIWDKGCTNLVFVWPLPQQQQPAADAVQSAFVRGAAVNMAASGGANLCFGDSSGSLYVMDLVSEGRFRSPVVFSHHRAPITCISSAYQSRQGRWTDDLGCNLVSCDESGAIAVWEALSSSEYRVVASITTSSVPVTSVAVRSGFIIAGRLDGSVHIYGLNDGKLRAEIQAQARWLTAMDIHPTKDVIATAGEDGAINVWTLPLHGQKATNLLNTVWMQAMPSGVAFCGPMFDDVAVVAYDTDEVRLYKYGK